MREGAWEDCGSSGRSMGSSTTSTGSRCTRWSWSWTSRKWRTLGFVRHRDLEYVEPIEKCEQNDQLVKDVQRSMNTIDVFESIKDHQEANRSQLMDILDSIFWQERDYKYYQGYHDIVTIFLLMLGTEMGYHASKKAADLYFRDYLKHNFDVTVIPQLEIVKELLK